MASYHCTVLSISERKNKNWTTNRLKVFTSLPKNKLYVVVSFILDRDFPLKLGWYFQLSTTGPCHVFVLPALEQHSASLLIRGHDRWEARCPSVTSPERASVKRIPPQGSIKKPHPNHHIELHAELKKKGRFVCIHSLTKVCNLLFGNLWTTPAHFVLMCEYWWITHRTMSQMKRMLNETEGGRFQMIAL